LQRVAGFRIIAARAIDSRGAREREIAVSTNGNFDTRYRRSSRDRNSDRDRNARRRRARAGTRASTWPSAADAALGADLARRTIAVDERAGRCGDTAPDARPCSDRNAHAQRATLQLQLFCHNLGYGMGGHCDGVQLYRGELGCHWCLHQLHHKHAAVTVHPARTISRAQRRQQSIFWYAIFRHAVF
jgi:hypothetical protein